MLRRLDSLVRKSLVVADHSATTTRYTLYETIRQFAEDRLAGSGRAGADTRDLHAAEFARPRRRGMGTVGRPRLARGRRLGRARARATFAPGLRWSSERGRLVVATDIAAHAALMGFSVQLFETLALGRGTARCRVEGRRPTPASALHGSGLRMLRRAARRCSPKRPPCNGIGGRRALRPLRAGLLNRSSRPSARSTAATSTATSNSPARWPSDTALSAGTALASYVDGLQSAGRVEEALAITERSVEVARQLGNPYWISYALWIAGMAFSRSDSRRALAAWDEGVAFVREHRVRFFEGFLARDAARLHTSDGEPEAALVLFGEAITVVPPGRQHPAADHHARERARRCSKSSSGYEPAATLLGAMAQQPSSFHHVPELAELEGRAWPAKLDAKRGSANSSPPAAPSASTTLPDYARQQIDVARRDPRPVARARPRPGGLSRRELEVLRLLAGGRTSTEIATELFISTRTAEHHIQNIYTKIDVSNRASATRWAVAHQVVAG